MHGQPRDIPVTIRFPERKVVKLILELRNVPGAMRGVSQKLEEENVNILSGFHSAAPDAESGMWSLFCDFTDARKGPKQVAEEIKKLEKVIEVDSREVEPGEIFVDEAHFPLMVAGERSVTMRWDGVLACETANIHSCSAAQDDGPSQSPNHIRGLGDQI